MIQMGPLSAYREPKGSRHGMVPTSLGWSVIQWYKRGENIGGLTWLGRLTDVDMCYMTILLQPDCSLHGAITVNWL